MSQSATNDTPTAAFHCSADWHLIRLGKYAAPIHALMLRVQDDDFFGSVPQMAEYFRSGENSIRRPLRKMKALGFVMQIASRPGESKKYRALTHKEWAERHPGQCCVKRDATGQGNMFDDTPSRTEALPSPERKPSPSRMEAKSPNQSPNKFPKDTDTAMQQKAAAPLHAAREAYKLFRQEMEDDSAFSLVLWILYRAASVKSGAQIPRSVDYYQKAKDSLIGQHERNWELVIADAEAKFCKHAYYFVEGESPDLLAWLKEEKARQVAAPAREVAATA